MSESTGSPPFLSRLAAKAAELEVRSSVLAAVRSFFVRQGYLEVDTPLLLETVAPEEHIEPIRCAEGFLATSPELQMKLLMAAGYERVFQITRSFRQGEVGKNHSPEFAILEWYRRGDAVEHLAADAAAMFRWVARELRGSGDLVWQGNSVNLEGAWRIRSVQEAFIDLAGWDPVTDFDPVRFDVDLVEKVEPHLGRGVPEFLAFYPAELGSLARLHPEDPAVALRVELYVEGLELANGFVELNDAGEQRRRFEKAAKGIRRQGRTPPPMPEAFLAALPQLPDCVGMALGLDRMVMLFADAASIDEVRPFGPEEA